MRNTIGVLLAALCSFTMEKERINDFHNEGSLRYTVGTILQIPYGQGPDSLGKPPMPYFGPKAFDVDWGKQTYFLFEAHDRILRSYSAGGRLIYHKAIPYPVFDLRVYEGDLYIFDGASIHVYESDNGDSLRRIDIAPLSTKPIVFANVSFFYDRFLILGDFDLSKWRNGLCYVFDLKTNRLSNRIDSSENFLPVTQCSTCNYDLVQRIVADNANDPAKGTFVFDGQSERFLIFAYYPGKGFSYQSPAGKADTYVFSKEKGSIKLLKNFGFLPAGSTTGKSFIFINDTSAVFAVVTYDKTTRHFRPLTLNRLTFQY